MWAIRVKLEGYGSWMWPTKGNPEEYRNLM
jgi:hypothetical protein